MIFDWPILLIKKKFVYAMEKKRHCPVCGTKIGDLGGFEAKGDQSPNFRPSKHFRSHDSWRQ